MGEIVGRFGGDMRHVGAVVADGQSSGSREPMAPVHARIGGGSAKIAIFGPLPPPHTGMEIITRTVLDELAARPAMPELRYRHIDLRVNRSQRERERFTVRKLARLLVQAISSWRAAMVGFDAYYPISQNRMGLLRDVVLLLPFRLAGRGIVIHLHGGALDQVLRLESKWLERLVRAVVATSRTRGVALTPSLRRCLRPLVEDERIFIVANTVHPPCSPVEVPDGQLAILFLSTLMPTKGYRELVGAVTHLARKGVPVQLRLAGEVWTDEDARWIADYDEVSAIEFLGPVTGDTKWSLIDQCHILALPSTAPEGQPLAILEAMARGRPVLTTDQGGIAETVGDAAGIVLARMQGDELRFALQAELHRLATDRQGVVDMGRSARSRFEQLFSAERFMESWSRAVGVEK